MNKKNLCHTTITCLTLFTLCTLLFASSAYAGKLDDFEKDATEKKENSEDDDNIGVLIEGIFKLIIDLSTEPENSDSSTSESVDSTKSSSTRKSNGFEREFGVAFTPYVRVDAAYQDVESDVEAYDLRLEFGYSFFAVVGRKTRYFEEDPDDTLDIDEFFLTIRLSELDIFEIDFGVGGLYINGDDINSGVAVSAAILCHPVDYAGFEIRGAWTEINENLIQDYDAAFMLGWRYTSVKVGYRTIISENESLDGPYLGLSLRF